MNTEVSVIIPSFNYGHLISETIDSLQSQTFKGWEAIVIDDGSSDNTRAVVGELALRDDRIKYTFQVNSGLSSARNTGIKLAKGSFIQFLDADDLLEPEKLASQLQFLKDHIEVDIVYSDVKYFKTINPSKFVIYKDHPAKLSGKGYSIQERLVKGNIMTPHCALVRSSVILEVGDFIKIGYLEDWNYWLRCAFKNFHFHYYSHLNGASLYRWHDSNMSKNYHGMLRDALYLRNYSIKEITDNSDFLELNEKGKRSTVLSYLSQLEQFATYESLSWESVFQFLKIFILTYNIQALIALIKSITKVCLRNMARFYHLLVK